MESFYLFGLVKILIIPFIKLNKYKIIQMDFICRGPNSLNGAST